MSNLDLRNILNNMIEWAPNDRKSDKLDRENYVPLGISFNYKNGLSVKKEDFFAMMAFIKERLSDEQSSLTDSFIRKKITNFLFEAYIDEPTITIEELLSIFSVLKRTKVDIFVKMFNLQIDVGEYDGGSFVLYNPVYFVEKYKNNLMYKNIHEKNRVHPDTIAHVGLVFKDVEIFQEDEERLNSIIQEKIGEFISVMGIAFGSKEKSQMLTANFNHIGMEYHLLDKDMIEIHSNYSSTGSTYLKGCIDLKTEHFFANHQRLFKLLEKHDNELKEKLYKSILWLGKSLLTENIGDSFLQVSIALECLLTRQTKGYYINPSISNSLSETLAFLIADTKEDRINNFKTIKKFYELRSSIVHSGRSEIKISQYYEFFQE